MKRGNKMKWKMFLGKRPLNHPHKMERISMCSSMDAWCVYCHQLFLCSCMYSFFAYSMLKWWLLYGCKIQNTNSISFRLLTFNAHCPFLFCTFPVYIITAHTDTTAHPYTRAYTWTRRKKKALPNPTDSCLYVQCSAAAATTSLCFWYLL